MAIFSEYTIYVENGKAKLDRDIYLTRGDSDIDIFFNIDGFDFLFADEITSPIGGGDGDGDGEITTIASDDPCTSPIEGIEDVRIGLNAFRIILRKPNEVKDLGKNIAPDKKIRLKVTKELLDELEEVGDYSMQIILYDNDGGSISLPFIHNQLHIANLLYEEGNDSPEIGSGGINQGHIAIGDDNTDIFNSTKGYNKTEWGNQDIITDSKMNKIENALSYLMGNKVIYKNTVGNSLMLGTDKYQSASAFGDIVINLPNVDYVCNFTLFLNCSKECKVTFRSQGDEQVVFLDKNNHCIKINYIGDWVINC